MIKDKIYICNDCGKKIYQKNSFKKFNGPKICAECFLYKQKKIQKICIAFICISLVLILFLLLPVNKKVQLIIAIFMFFVGLVALIFIFFLKIISKKKFFD